MLKRLQGYFWTLKTTPQRKDDGMKKSKLRDEFAKAALIGWITSQKLPPAEGDAKKKQVGELIAKQCYAMADFMIKERKKS